MMMFYEGRVMTDVGEGRRYSRVAICAIHASRQCRMVDAVRGRM